LDAGWDTAAAGGDSGAGSGRGAGEGCIGDGCADDASGAGCAGGAGLGGGVGDGRADEASGDDASGEGSGREAGEAGVGEGLGGEASGAGAGAPGRGFRISLSGRDAPLPGVLGVVAMKDQGSPSLVEGAGRIGAVGGPAGAARLDA
jgi:hypothetical protein